ncbi:hypothetical protein HDE_04961 [Halotydeus destructor]|nr:hypothetical protein HDE_04961 [Halotydeus destructor]
MPRRRSKGSKKAPRRQNKRTKSQSNAETIPLPKNEHPVENFAQLENFVNQSLTSGHFVENQESPAMAIVDHIVDDRSVPHHPLARNIVKKFEKQVDSEPPRSDTEGGVKGQQDGGKRKSKSRSRKSSPKKTKSLSKSKKMKKN